MGFSIDIFIANDIGPQMSLAYGPNHRVMIFGGLETLNST